MISKTRFIGSAGSIVSMPVLAAICLMSTAAATRADDGPVTFNEHVAPIVFANCAVCHRPGEVAPMSLMTHEDARPWAKSIKEKVAAKEMPPWHADSTKIKYKNERGLTDEEIATIVQWVDQGARPGNPESLPEPPTFPEGWRMGEPDMIFEVKKAFVVPDTEENIPYQSVTFNIDLTEDLYISEWEIRPSDLQVVHHANLVRSPKNLDGTNIGISSAVIQGGDYIGSYLPGHSVVGYDEGTAYLLPAGTHIGIQVHYVGVGKEVTDKIKFGVKFAQGRVDQIVRVVGTDRRDIDIAPYQPDFTIVDEITLLYDVMALTSGAHMHLRGSSYTMEAILPDGSSKLITDVPHYNFNWQTNYVLAEPVFVPKNSKLRVTSVWDNSKDNPLNPDPSARVRYGPWTEDEMINSWMHVVLADQKLGLKIVDGRVVGKYDDALDTPIPFLIQSLPGSAPFQRGAEQVKKIDSGETQ